MPAAGHWVLYCTNTNNKSPWSQKNNKMLLVSHFTTTIYWVGVGSCFFFNIIVIPVSSFRRANDKAKQNKDDTWQWRAISTALAIATTIFSSAMGNVSTLCEYGFDAGITIKMVRAWRRRGQCYCSSHLAFIFSTIEMTREESTTTTTSHHHGPWPNIDDDYWRGAIVIFGDDHWGMVVSTAAEQLATSSTAAA